MRSRPLYRASRGFTYLTGLFLVAMIGAGVAHTAVFWQAVDAREREEQLLFVGHAYRRAIELYYANTPGPVKRYPRDLTELLKDPRQQSVKRYLRNLYTDPVTGKPEWGTVTAPDGGIAGIYSLSAKEPMKQGNFVYADSDFQERKTYSEWKFVYLPMRSPAPPGTAPAQPLR